MTKSNHKREVFPENEPPPILGSWKRMYVVVLVLHAILIFCFWLFSQYWS